MNNSHRVVCLTVYLVIRVWYELLSHLKRGANCIGLKRTFRFTHQTHNPPATQEPSNRPSPHPFSLAHIHLVGSQIQGYQFLNFVVALFFIFPPALLYLFIFICIFAFRYCLFLFLFLSQLINLFNGIGWLSIDWPAHWLNASLTYSLCLPTVVGFLFSDGYLSVWPTLHSPLSILHWVYGRV